MSSAHFRAEPEKPPHGGLFNPWGAMPCDGVNNSSPNAMRIPRGGILRLVPACGRGELEKTGLPNELLPVIHGAQARKAASFSLGVIQPRHLRGRSLRNLSIRLSSDSPISAKEDPLG